MNVQRPLTGAERARRWRAAMRAKGLRPKVFWVPDTSSPEFIARAARDTEILNRWYREHPEEVVDVLAMHDWPEDDPD
jgi:DNA-binding LacI/PurR family transcriptional regulator